MRELAALTEFSSDMVDQYLEVEDWRVKENSNMSYSLQGLNNYLSSTVIAKYWIAASTQKTSLQHTSQATSTSTT
jgi:ribonucleoside-triphosphate reductase (formate)